MPDETVPEVTGPEETVSEVTGPAETVSEVTGPAETGPEKSALDETGPDETVPEETGSVGPLAGVRVVVTRAREQAGPLADALAERGATAVTVPVIEIVDPLDGGAALRERLALLGRGDWLVITSPNGAARVSEALADVPLKPGVSVAVIGPGTAGRARDLGISVDLIPDTSIAEGLLAAMPAPSRPGATVLLARASQARRLLPEELRRRGWTVHDVAAYQTVGIPVDEADRTACRNSDVVAFTSSSTVSRLHGGVGAENLPGRIASIGPATSATARALGLTVDVEAEPHTIDGLVDAIVSLCADAAAGAR